MVRFAIFIALLIGAALAQRGSPAPISLEPLHAAAYGVKRGQMRKPIRTRLDKQIPMAGFTSVEDAVIHAARQYNADSVQHNREHVGGVLRCEDGRYVYTHGVGARNQVPVVFSVVQTKSCRLHALWHTHGSPGRDKSHFSPSDTQAAIQVGKPIYLVDPKGVVRVFSPDDPMTIRVKNSLSNISQGKGAWGTVVKDNASTSIEVATRE